MPGPGRREALSRARIVEAAAAVVEEHGPDAVSMRAVAARLGSGTMSLYRHVADRDELLELVLAQMVAEIALPEPTGRWRDDLAGIARAVRGGLVARPGMTALLSARGGQGTAGLGLIDAGLGVLRAAGFAPREAVLAGSALGSLVAGAVLQDAAGGGAPADGEATPGRGGTADRMDDGSGPDADSGRAGCPPPEPTGPELVDVDWASAALTTISADERFEYGLRIVLDGIAAFRSSVE